MSEEPIKDKIEEMVENPKDLKEKTEDFNPQSMVEKKVEEKMTEQMPKIDIDELVERGFEQTKAKIPKYFKIDENIRQSRLGKFLQGIGKSGAYALIPLTIILVGLLFNLYGLQTTISVDNSQEYQNMVLTNSRPLAFDAADRLDTFFDQQGDRLINLRNNLNQNLTSARIPSFLPNATFTPNSKFSQLYNTSIDQTVSSIGFWEGRIPSNATIAYAESITVFLQDAFAKTSRALYVRAVYIDGIIQTYPFIKSNDSISNPLEERWYNETFIFDPRGYHFEGPYVDPVVNRPVVSLSLPFLRSGALLGAIQIVIDFEGVRGEISTFETSINRLTVLSNDSKVLFDRSLDLAVYGLNSTTFNHTLTELDNSTEAATIADFLSGVTDQSQFRTFDLNKTEFAIWGFKINSTGFSLSYLVELPTETVQSTFDPTEMFLLPGLATIVALFMVLFLQLRYGLLQGKDIETLIRDVLRKSKVDNISNRLRVQVDRITSGEIIQDVAESATEKIQKKGEEIRETISEGIEGKISALEDSIEEKMDQLEEALEPEEAEPVTEIFERGKILSRVLDGFANDPILYLQNKFNAKGIDLDKIRKGDFSSLKNLTTEPERMLATLTAGGKIPLKDMADLTSIDQTKIENFLGSLPSAAGIGIDEVNEIVTVDRSKFISNLKEVSPLFKKFFEDPEGYLKSVPGDNYQKLERNKEKVKILAKLLGEGEEVPVQQIANVLGIKKEKVDDLLNEVGKKSQVKFKFKKGKVKVNNKDKFIKNLPQFSGVLIEKLIMNTF